MRIGEYPLHLFGVRLIVENTELEKSLRAALESRHCPQETIDSICPGLTSTAIAAMREYNSLGTRVDGFLIRGDALVASDDSITMIRNVYKISDGSKIV